MWRDKHYIILFWFDGLIKRIDWCDFSSTSILASTKLILDKKWIDLNLVAVRWSPFVEKDAPLYRRYTSFIRSNMPVQLNDALNVSVILFLGNSSGWDNFLVVWADMWLNQMVRKKKNSLNVVYFINFGHVEI